MARKPSRADKAKADAPRQPNRLVLCFDGTGNAYLGNPADTNIIKLLEMLDRSSPRQMHYYQPGIGTYTTDSSVNKSLFGRIKSSISQTIDTGVGTTFDAHVMAGYRFLMRYYMEGDRIYIFGFSRGAFTARFVARMVSHVGLLSMGNEEMVPFAFKLYQDYEMNHTKWQAYMIRFRSAFCRHNSTENLSETPAGGFKVYFLGLFDTVGSVGTLDRGLVTPPAIHATARFVRHAVAVDERRVKFKAALLAQDKTAAKDEDVKEVWFPGNHGDVGGGWPAKKELDKRPWFWERFWGGLSSEKDNETALSMAGDQFQLSDIALKWMIDELQDTERRHLRLDSVEELDSSDDALAWSPAKDDYLARYNDRSHDHAITGFMHDTMVMGGGSALGKTAFWNIMEYLPGIWRWEYYTSAKEYGWWYRMFAWMHRGNKDTPEPDTFPAWKQTYFPLNGGETRDIPADTLVHHAVLQRMQLYTAYRPTNKVFGSPDSGSTDHHLFEAANSRAVTNGASKPANQVYFVKDPENTVGAEETDTIYQVKLH